MLCSGALASCADELDPELETSDADPAPTLELSIDLESVDWLKGANCAYGTFGCNVCVPDVPGRFKRASGSKDVRHGFGFDPNYYADNGPHPDDFAPGDHIQGITRIPGLGNENWLALSRNARDAGDGAFYLTGYPQISGHGDAWKWAERSTRNPTSMSHFYYRVPGVNHVGGLQALGPMLFAPFDCDEGLSCNAGVNIYDVRDPGQAQLLSTLSIDNSRGELHRSDGDLSSRAAAVGAVRLENGQTLLFVRGREADAAGWFYKSLETTIDANTHWELVTTWRNSDLPSGTAWHPWETVNLVSDCNDGSIYAVMMGTTDNKSFLYRVVGSLRTESSLTFQLAGSRGLNTSGPLTSTRFGGGVHVTPNGNFVSYVTDRHPTVEIEEFRYHGDHGN